MEQDSNLLLNRKALENFFINSNVDINFSNFFIAIILSLILAYIIFTDINFSERSQMDFAVANFCEPNFFS